MFPFLVLDALEARVASLAAQLVARRVAPSSRLVVLAIVDEAQFLDTIYPPNKGEGGVITGVARLALRVFRKLQASLLSPTFVLLPIATGIDAKRRLQVDLRVATWRSDSNPEMG